MRRLVLPLALVALLAAALPAVAAGTRAPLGEDGRLTLLFIGSDLRSYPPRSERTDTIMVVSIEPVSGATTVASLPRDVEGLPLPGPSAPAAARVAEWREDRYDGKVNALFGTIVARIRARDQIGYEAAVTRALTPLRRTFAYAIGVEIDGVALVAFGTVRALAKEIRGELEVELPAGLRFRDCSATLAAPDGCVDYRPAVPKGATSVTVRVPAEEWLGFARSRKADQDYARAARGQLLLAGIVRRLRAEGPTAAIGILASIATRRGLLRTDLSLFAAPDLWAIMSRADLTSAKRTVFGPSRFAGAGAARYQVLLKPEPMRTWVSANLPPAAQAGAWPLPFVGIPSLPLVFYANERAPFCPYRSPRPCLR